MWWSCHHWFNNLIFLILSFKALTVSERPPTLPEKIGRCSTAKRKIWNINGWQLHSWIAIRIYSHTAWSNEHSQAKQECDLIAYTWKSELLEVLLCLEHQAADLSKTWNEFGLQVRMWKPHGMFTQSQITFKISSCSVWRTWQQSQVFL